MKLSAAAVVARAKLTRYLLQKRPENDKSAFLALAGYTREHPARLEADIRSRILTQEAELMESTEYGDKYRIGGVLVGPNGRALKVLTIWMTEEATGLTKFVTLYPDKD